MVQLIKKDVPLLAYAAGEGLCIVKESPLSTELKRKYSSEKKKLRRQLSYAGNKVFDCIDDFVNDCTSGKIKDLHKEVDSSTKGFTSYKVAAYQILSWAVYDMYPKSKRVA